jgi:hypothetical protein
MEEDNTVRIKSDHPPEIALPPTPLNIFAGYEIVHRVFKSQKILVRGKHVNRFGSGLREERRQRRLIIFGEKAVPESKANR